MTDVRQPPPNPYIGPRAFQRDETLYGRDREARDLLYLLMAERFVLLHSPSGAGKSSLIEAKLAPQLLKQGFDVLPTMRVSHGLAAEFDLPRDANPYVVSLLLYLERETGLQEKWHPDMDPQEPGRLANLTLAEYLNQRLEASQADSVVLVFDQFEEVLTVDPTGLDAKKQFFEQVGNALCDSRLWALFAMREEYLGALRPFLRPIPSQLRTTYRLELLGVEAARAAIQEPARKAGVAFSDAAATKLVNNLREVQMVRPDGTIETHHGLFVEPVQLQVVCRRLWDQLPDDATQIIESDVADVGDVDSALADYYAETVKAVADRTNTSERSIRDWFGIHLITEQGVRGQALQGPERSQGLPNQAISQLVDAHLVRAEQRRGATWFELAHDRLKKPVREDNAQWTEAHLAPLQKAAALWDAEGRKRGLLLRDEALQDAEAWQEVHTDESTSVEEEFLAASQEAEASAQRERRQARLILWLAIIATAIMVIAVILAVFALRARQKAERESQVAHARQLAVRAELERTNPRGSLALAGLLAVESLDRWPTVEANVTLRRLLRQLGRPSSTMVHGGPVYAMSISPDGELVATASADGKARLWDLSTGAELVHINHEGEVTAIEIGHEGRWVVSGSDDGVVHVWEAATGREVASMRHAGKINAVAFNPNDQLVISGSEDGTARVWEAGTGKGVASTEHMSSVAVVAFSPDGQRAASGSDDGIIKLWDTTGWSQLERPAHSAQISDLAFDPSGRWLVSASQDKTLRVTHSDTGETSARMHHDGRVFTVAFNPVGDLIASGSDDLTARIWRAADGEAVTRLEGHGAPVTDARFSPDGLWVATGSNDHTARVWNVITGEEVTRVEHDGEVNAVGFAFGGRFVVSASADGTVRTWDVSRALRESMAVGKEIAVMSQAKRMNDVAVSPDMTGLLSVGADGCVRMWDVSNPLDDGSAPAKEFAQVEDNVRFVVYSPDGQLVVSGNDDGTVQVRDVATSRLVTQVRHERQANVVAFSPNGIWAASGGGDGIVRVWDIATGEEVSRMDHGWEVNALAFSSDGAQLASVSKEGTRRIWNPATGKEEDPQNAYFASTLSTVALSSDGQWIAAGYHDGTVRAWEVDTKREIAQMKHLNEVLDVTFSADGRWLATASRDGTARVWEATTGRELARVEHVGWPEVVAFSGDAHWLVTVSYNTAWIWSWQPDDLARQACAYLPRDFSSDEWQEHIGNEPRKEPTCPGLRIPGE